MLNVLLKIKFIPLIFLVGSTQMADYIEMANKSNLHYYNIDDSAVTGYDCTTEQSPHLVTILRLKSLHCGGTLIKSNFVLTAAHCCLEMDDLQKYSVKAGLKVWDKQFQYRTRISKVYIHKNFRTAPLGSDVCIVELQNDVKLNDEVRITPLVTKEQFKDIMEGKMCKKATVMGFGDQDMKPVPEIRSKRGYSPHVQCATLAVDRSKCQDVFNGTVDDTIFCGVDPTLKARDACQGDSGGPLLCKGLQIGIIAAGLGCGIPGYPGLYSRVDVLLDFIDEVTTEGLTAPENRKEDFKSDSTPCFLSSMTLLVCIYINYEVI